MAMLEILMPDIGEGVTEAEIVEWNVKLGDLVREDDVLAAVMTDKATVEIPSPADGAIISIFGNVGDVIAVGETLVRLEVSKQTGATHPTGAENAAQPEPDLPNQQEGDQIAPLEKVPVRPLAAPAVRRRAAESGVNLSEVPASGPGGRITTADLEAWISSRASVKMDTPSELTGQAYEEIKVVGLRRNIAEQMQIATRSVAPMTYVEEVDVTDLEELRENLNSDRSRHAQTRLTILPFLMIAMIRALKESPRLNSHYDDEAGLIRQFRCVHIGLAAQTSDGLLVPVIRNAEALDLHGLGAEIIRLAEAAKSRSITREELTGSTITLSSLGKMGGLVSTPIINSPEVAIVGVNKISVRQVWQDGVFVARKIMNLSSTFDHRIVDGWDAANFIQDVKALLESPASILGKD